MSASVRRDRPQQERPSHQTRGKSRRHLQQGRYVREGAFGHSGALPPQSYQVSHEAHRRTGHRQHVGAHNLGRGDRHDREGHGRHARQVRSQRAAGHHGRRRKPAHHRLDRVSRLLGRRQHLRAGGGAMRDAPHVHAEADGWLAGLRLHRRQPVPGMLQPSIAGRLLRAMGRSRLRVVVDDQRAVLERAARSRVHVHQRRSALQPRFSACGRVAAHSSRHRCCHDDGLDQLPDREREVRCGVRGEVDEPPVPRRSRGRRRRVAARIEGVRGC